MHRLNWEWRSLRWLAGVLVLWVLPTLAVQAQVPALLIGQWEMHQISFLAEHTVPDSVLHQMDNPQVAALNNEIKAGVARALVEFRPDGTYQFTLVRGDRTERTETGSYSVQNNTLFAQSPTTQGGSSFNDQYLTRLTRRGLTITFVVGAELPGVLEEVEYRRFTP